MLRAHPFDMAGGVMRFVGERLFLYARMSAYLPESPEPCDGRFFLFVLLLTTRFCLLSESPTFPLPTHNRKEPQNSSPC